MSRPQPFVFLTNGCYSGDGFYRIIRLPLLIT